MQRIANLVVFEKINAAKCVFGCKNRLRYSRKLEDNAALASLRFRELYNPRIHARACRKVFLFLLSAALCTVVALNSAFPFRSPKERLDSAEELSMLRSLPALR